MALASPATARMVPRGLALHITHQRELMPEVQRSQLPMELGVQGKHITRTPVPMAPPDKLPMPMGTTEVRLFQKVDRLRIHSTRPQRKARWERYKLLLGAEALRQVERAVTLAPSKPRAEISMLLQTGMSTRTQETGGNKLRGRRANQDRPRTIPLCPVATAPHEDGDNGKERAEHRPLVVPAEAVGNPGRKAPVVRQAVVVAAVAAKASRISEITVRIDAKALYGYWEMI